MHSTISFYISGITENLELTPFVSNWKGKKENKKNCLSVSLCLRSCVGSSNVQNEKRRVLYGHLHTKTYIDTYLYLLMLIHTSHRIVSIYIPYLTLGYPSYPIYSVLNPKCRHIYFVPCTSCSNQTSTPARTLILTSIRSMPAHSKPIHSSQEVKSAKDAQCQIQKWWNERKPGPLS